MDEIIKILSEIISKSGYPILILGIFAIGYTFREFMLSNNFKYLLDKIPKFRTITLKDHDLFQSKAKMNLLINKFDAPHSHVNELFKELFKLKCNSIIDKSKVLISQKEFDLIDNLKAIIETYEKSFKEYCLYRYRVNGHIISEYILKEYMNFHQNNVDFILESLDIINSTKLITKKEDILFYYFSLLNVSMMKGIANGEKVFRTFNGYLTSLINEN